ncbi:MAG: ABC transporter permease [Crenarchaeota archaeon]|nr:ABC transporter permease [Thermoproteota archaeon]
MIQLAGLGRYLVRRAITFIPTIIGITLLTFTIAFYTPADPARAWAGGQKARPEVVEQVRKMYHLDEPFWTQYYFFMRHILSGSIYSPVTHNNIIVEWMQGFIVTANIAVLATFFTIILGIPLGIIAALRKDTAIDNTVRLLALIGYSTPSFWIAYIFVWIFYDVLRWITLVGVPIPSRIITGLFVIDAIILGEFNILDAIVSRLLLPSFILAFISFGGLARYVRNTMLDVLSSDYILYAHARGLPPFRVWRHALKNSLIPVVTVILFMFAGLLSGAIITETVFQLPGIGYKYVLAINNFDIPSIILYTLMTGLFIVITSLLVDILYAIIDPRIRL